MSNCSDSLWPALALLFETRYWLYLADFGQTSPSPYVLRQISPTSYIFESPGNWTDNTSTNIFVNSTLYRVAVDSINSEFGPLGPTADFNNSTGILPLKQDDSVVLYQNYYCQQRQLKGPINLLLNVIAADYALIAGAYNFVVLVATLIEKRRKQGVSSRIVNLMYSKLLRRMRGIGARREVSGGLGCR
jgi:hypothetical protein